MREPVSQYPFQNVEYMSTNRISAVSTLTIPHGNGPDLAQEYLKLSSKRNDRTGKIESLIELLRELNYCNPEVELGDDYLTYSSEERLSYVFNGLYLVAQADNGDFTERTYHAAMASLALLVYSEPIGSPISIAAHRVFSAITELVNNHPIVVG